MNEQSYFTKIRDFLTSFFRGGLKIVSHLSPSDRLVFGLLVIFFIASSFSLLLKANQYILVEIPARGGTYIEGIAGTPRFINPLLAVTDADRDLTAIVYSGLMKRTPSGLLITDLAESYSIGDSGLSYRFIIKADAVFHDKTPVSADDVVFTVTKAQDSGLKSPKRASWDGVLVRKINDREVEFILEQPYAPFLQNTTLGILPAHLWGEKSVEEFTFTVFNTEPIGSGPYMLKKIKRDASGVPEYYEFSSFSQYTLGQPYIKTLVIRYYPNEDRLIDAYLDGEIGALNSVSSKGLALIELNKKDVRVERSSLPRIFGVFFNQNQAPVLANIEVRAALNAGLDKEIIIREILGGNGIAINSPIPPGAIYKVVREDDLDMEDGESRSHQGRAIDILDRNGWTVNEETGIWEKETKKGTQILSFSLSTSDVPELKQTVGVIAREWRKIGVDVNVKIFESGDLNQNVIRPRKYDALFFGEIVGQELDLFAFWHSSQRNDPGLNIALYTNITVDKLLEEARTVYDKELRNEKYLEFEKVLTNDIPAVFVYSPDFIYIIPQNVRGISLGSVTASSERFANIHKWHFDTNYVWSIFSR